MRVIFNYESIEVSVPISPMLEYTHANQAELVEVALSKLFSTIHRPIESWNVRVEVN